MICIRQIAVAGWASELTIQRSCNKLFMRNDVFRHRKQCSVDMLGTVLYNNVTGDYVDSRLQKHCHQHTYVMYHKGLDTKTVARLLVEIYNSRRRSIYIRELRSTIINR